MICADVEILICDYLDGTLPAERKSALERHLGVLCRLHCVVVDEKGIDKAKTRKRIAIASAIFKCHPSHVTGAHEHLKRSRGKCLVQLFAGTGARRRHSALRFVGCHSHHRHSRA